MKDESDSIRKAFKDRAVARLLPPRVLLMLTLPLTAFFVPLVLLSVVQKQAQRICMPL